MTDNTFEPAAGHWAAGLGRLRDAVRQELVRRQLAEVLPSATARILDVGCGQGTQVLHLARSGHDVTGLDPSVELLSILRTNLDAEPPAVRGRVRTFVGRGEDAARVAPGPYDAVLCHGVLMYLDDDRPLLEALTAVAVGGARLSLLVRNRAGIAMRAGLLGRWDAVGAAFDATSYDNRLGVRARAHTLDELDAMLRPLGWRRERWYGVRVLTDHLDEPAPEASRLAAIVEAEDQASRRDPYRAVAALLHVVYAR